MMTTETTKIYTTTNLYGLHNINQVTFFIADCETALEETEQFCFALVTMPMGTLVFEAQSTQSESVEGFTWMVIANTIEDYRSMLKGSYTKVSIYTKEYWEELGFTYKG